MRRAVAIAGLVIGTVTLGVQAFVIIALSMETGRGLIASMIYYFSFFTILTNLLVVLIYLGAIVRGRRWLMFFRKPHTRAMAVATIVLVGGFYHFILAGDWHQEGLLYWCNIILHYVTPLVYLVWFIAWNRTGTLAWRAMVTMLAFPLVYLIYILVRGALIAEYPYSVLDVAQFGHVQVAINAAGLLLVLLVLNAATVAVDRSLLAGRSN